MELVPLVKHFEGLHRIVTRKPVVTVAPYLCPANFWTIGYGRVVPKDHRQITEPEADQFLDEDLAKFRAIVQSMTRPGLTRGQLDALTSFTFNLGGARYRSSTLRAMVNRGEMAGVPDQFRRWVFGGGRKLPGLVLRREAEIELWVSRDT